MKGNSVLVTICLEIKGKNIFLNGIRVKGVEKFKTTLSSDLPEGKELFFFFCS